MKVTVILIVIDALGTAIKVLLKELEDVEIRGRVETIQTITLLRSARILRSVLETWRNYLSKRLEETICHSKLSEKPSANVVGKTLKRVITVLIIQSDHLISARRPEFVIGKKKKREFAEEWTLPSQQATE